MGISGSSLTNALGSVPVIGPVVDIGSAIAGLFGGGGKPDGRYASNTFAFQAAMAGNENGLIALKGHAGYGDGVLKGPIPGIPEYKAGSHMITWPADGPRKDAQEKYAQVMAAAQAGSGGAAQAAGADPGSIGAAVDKAKDTIAGLPTWAALAGAAVLGVLLVRMARR